MTSAEIKDIEQIGAALGETLTISQYAERLAFNLGPEWRASADDDYQNPRVFKQDGSGFWIRLCTYGSDRGKYEIHPIWMKDRSPYFSKYSDHGEKSPSIMFSATKLPSVGAADIQRRFLPEYQVIWDKVFKEYQAHDLFLAKRLEQAKQVVAIVGGKVIDSRPNNYPCVQLGYRDNGITDIDLGEGKVSIKMTVDLDMLQQIQLLLDGRQ